MICAPRLDIRRALSPGLHVTFGRDPTAVLCFPGDNRLSRYAGEIRWGTDGLTITNVSSRHSLFVESITGSAELEPCENHHELAAFVLGGGTATVSGPWPGSQGMLSVEILPGARLGGRPIPAAGTTTEVPLRLRENSKLFVTALLLCRPRLAGAQNGPPVVPTVPELTRQILVATDSFHLLPEFDDGGPGRKRLTARVHDQLAELRDKLVRHGLAAPGSRLPSPALVELLVRHRIVTKRHLLLLGDPAWRTAQYERWWR